MFKVKTNTPLSGPGILKAVRKRGRKRKINEALSMQEGDEESWENDYRGRLLKLWKWQLLKWKKNLWKVFITTACMYVSSRLNCFNCHLVLSELKMSTLESCQTLACFIVFRVKWAQLSLSCKVFYLCKTTLFCNHGPISRTSQNFSGDINP